MLGANPTASSHSAPTRACGQSTTNTRSAASSRLSATLMVHFYGAPRAGGSVPVDEDGHYYIRVDAVSGEIVGVKLEDFAAVIVPPRPSMLEAAEVLVIRPEEIAKLRRNQTRESRTRAAGELMCPFLCAS